MSDIYSHDEKDSHHMRLRVLFLTGLIVLLFVLLLGCSLGGGSVSSVTPTPTKTLRPMFTSTLTPTVAQAATETPLPTPTPPAPTDTPIPTETLAPTETSTPTVEASPTNTASAPADTAAPPTDTPPPRPTSTPVPPTNTPQPQVDFKVKEIVAFENGSLGSSGLHNIYFTVVDGGGATMDGIILKDVANQPGDEVITGNKGPGKTEFTMWAADYRFQVAGNTSGRTFTSETTHVLSVLFGHAVWDDLIRGGICPDAPSCEALGPIHYSYNVTFQRTW
jgi:hypothetical protein